MPLFFRYNVSMGSQGDGSCVSFDSGSQGDWTVSQVKGTVQLSEVKGTVQVSHLTVFFLAITLNGALIILMFQVIISVFSMT